MELADAVPDASGQSSVVGDPSSGSEVHPPVDSPPNTDPRITDYSPRTLRSDLAAGRLPAVRVLALALALALTEALGHLHASGLVHRDIKPSNIIFVAGRPKLADIGLVTGAAAGDDARSIVGTEGYLPPEGPGTPAADLFALGRVLYEALTGLDRRQYPDLPIDLRTWPDRALAFELNEVILRAGSTGVRERYPAAGELSADLERLGAGGSVRRHHLRRRLAKTVGWTLAGSLVVALMVLGGMRLQEGSRKRAANTTHGWTTNQEAANLAEKAFYLQIQSSPNNLPTARRYLEQALRLGPQFASAHAALAEQAWQEAKVGFREPKEALREAEVSVRQALTLDPQLAYAHTLLGEVVAAGNHNWTEAELHHRRAIELDPDSPRARTGYALTVLLSLGRTDKALEQIQQAIQLDPGSPNGFAAKARALYLARRYPEALREIDQVSELRPDLRWNLNLRAQTLSALGDQAGAIAACEAIIQQVPDQAWPRAKLFYTRTLAGQTRADEPRAAFGLALAYTALGNHPAALTWLETACDRHQPESEWIKVDPRFDPLRDERRFRDLLKRMNLEPQEQPKPMDLQ